MNRLKFTLVALFFILLITSIKSFGANEAEKDQVSTEVNSKSSNLIVYVGIKDM